MIEAAFFAVLALLVWREWQHDRERRVMRREFREERRALLREALPHIEYATPIPLAPMPYGGDAQEWQVERDRRVAAGLPEEDDLEPNYV